jgi:hypothetical protein
MLKKVLDEVKNASGAVDLNGLAKKLGIERSALDGMVQFWVRKGRLTDDDLAEDNQPFDACGSCAGSCPGPKSCPFVFTAPRTYSLTLHANPPPAAK